MIASHFDWYGEFASKLFGVTLILPKLLPMSAGIWFHQILVMGISFLLCEFFVLSSQLLYALITVSCSATVQFDLANWTANVTPFLSIVEGVDSLLMSVLTSDSLFGHFLRLHLRTHFRHLLHPVQLHLGIGPSNYFFLRWLSRRLEWLTLELMLLSCRC